jgi:hypothetical protein
MAEAKTVVAAAKSAASRAKTEGGERSAVQRTLIHYGHFGMPKVEVASEGRSTLRLYVWDTQWGPIILSTGPSIEGEVFLAKEADWDKAPAATAYVPSSKAPKKLTGKLVAPLVRLARRAEDRIARQTAKAIEHAPPPKAKKPKPKPKPKPAPVSAYTQAMRAIAAGDYDKAGKLAASLSSSKATRIYDAIDTARATEAKKPKPARKRKPKPKPTGDVGAFVKGTPDTPGYWEEVERASQTKRPAPAPAAPPGGGVPAMDEKTMAMLEQLMERAAASFD